MELTPLLMYESFILVIGVAAVAAFAVFYFRLLRGYNELRLDHEKLKKELDEYGNVVAASSKEHIQKLVAHSQELSDDLKNELTKLLAAQAQKEAGAYEKVVHDVGEELEKESEAQVAEFATSLKKEVVESEGEIREKISKLYDDARSEVEKMRQDAQAEITTTKTAVKKELTEHVYDIIQDVIKETTGQLLTKQDHEGIVLSSLEDAMKRHGV
jgi:hypothetical protein